MEYRKRRLSCVMAVVLVLSVGSLKTGLAQIAPPLGTAQKFAVLGASTVTSTGATVLTGDLGVSPGSAITGFPPGLVTGTIHAADAVAAQAQLDALTAYNFLAAEACTTNLSGTDLGGLTLMPGVYCFNSSAQLTGTLTLNAAGNPNPVFVFKIGSTFITASNSAVVITGGSPCNVYFQVGSSATLGTGTRLLGSIFAKASITTTTGASVTGGSYALGGAVTLDGNAVTACTGTIQVCKVAGSGVVAGTNFGFSIAGNPATAITVPAGPSPGGSCGPALLVPAQPTTITETIPTGTTLAAVSTLPGPGLLISSNLGAGTATVAVNPGAQTIATFVDTVPPVIPTTGFLQICKVAGSGVTAGTPFTFNVAGTPVTVPAGAAPGGSCSPALVVQAGQTLITESLPTGTTLTDVRTLPNAGLLVSSNLAAGMATVTVNAGGQTIATFTDTVNPITGFLQICKVAGSGIAVGTNFAFSIAGNPATAVTVPAGPGPAGSCSPQVEVPAGTAIVTETLPAGILLASVNTLPSAGLLVSSNLGAGTATVTVNAGGVTIATFTNTVVPVTTGFLQICKVAGSGINTGTNFTFNVAGNIITLPAGPAPTGSCSPPMMVPGGPVNITETLPAGTALTSVITLPSGLLVSSNLAAGTATVTVNAGGQTIVTFLDTLIPVIPTTGFLQICKVAGSGVTVGTNFAFSVAGNPAIAVTVPAGAAPTGSCSPAIVVPAGPAIITETVPSGIALTSVSTMPSGLLVSSNLSAGTATVTVNAGGQTIVTFLDTLIPVIPTTGLLQICKIAGAGVAVGTNFTFNVAGTPVTVPAGAAPGGSCGPALVVPVGATNITETLPSGTTLTSVSTLPSGLLVSSNLAAGTATVTVNAGGQTIVTFLNTIIPVIPTTGFLQICKIAGSGVTPTTNFTFNVEGNLITVPAGPAPGGSCSPALVAPVGANVITETLPSGTELTSVSTLPGGLLVSSNLAAGTATVTVNPGGQTIVTFLNTLIPVIPTTGFIQVCKIAGSGVAVGTPVTFNVAGTPLTVPAGPAPGGSCGPALIVPAGPAIITETLPSGTALTSVSTLPSGLLISSNLAAGTATVTVNAGGQTIVTFLDTLIPVIPTTGLLQICKIAGAGVAVGTNFTFNVAGNLITVPAGPAPGGSCGPALVVPVGATNITETLPSGVALTSVSTLPSGLLVSSNLSGGTATVTVNAAGQTIVTFLNTLIPIIPTTGFIQVCKIAGSGITPGTNFTFNVAGTAVTVPAGAAPGGTCSPALVVPAGPAIITETLPSGIALTSVSTLPSGQLVSSSLAAGTATVTVNAGGQTIVTFLDTLIPVIPTTGFIQVCKIAGSGVAVGTNFTFNVGGTPVTVPAGAAPGGSCGPAMVVPVGPTVITETLPSGTALTSVSTLPSGLLVSSNLPAGTATVMVNAGGQTIVTFLNTLIPVIPSTGLLQICKIAGAGIAVGTNFTFNVAGTPITVPAGAAPGGSCGPAVVVPVGATVITETLPTGVALTSVSTLPNGLLLSSDMASGTATVTVNPGGQTIVTFLNAIIPAATGFLQICKIAGSGVTPGTNFTFNVGGNMITVPAGAAPGGSCSQSVQLPAGQAVVTEVAQTGVSLMGVAASPSGRLVSSNLTDQTAAVTIVPGGVSTQTIVTFTNQAGVGLLKICKVAGPGVTVGTQFTFTVGSNTISVPAGFCALGGSYPLGTQLTAVETIPAGLQVTAINVLPADRALSAPNLSTGTVAFTIGSGVTEVDFTNMKASVEMGQLRVCKIAGTGLTPGANFTFVVAGASLTVPAGSCVMAAASFPVGTSVTVAETPSAGTVLSAISVLPVARQGAVNLPGGTVTVTIGTGVTEVDFTNAAAGFGLLKVCKIAGAGVASGANFSFVAAGTSLTVPAGFCVRQGLLPIGTVVTITELFSSATVASAISVLPADRQGTVDLPGRTITATIGDGVTEVYFTNVAK